jgi:DegV family protein with EDD domain
MDPAGIAAELNAMTDRVDASFIVSQLTYLKKGGRCSSAAALGANLLNLKPCIVVADGKMQVGKKYRGSFAKCIELYVKDRLADMELVDTDRIFITHSGVEEESIEIARKAVCSCGNFKEILITRAGCTISSHCGPGTLGVLFIANE